MAIPDETAPPPVSLRLQAILRRINDEIAEQAAASADAAFVCECGDRACVEAIELPLDLYRQLRLVPNRFAVRRDHVDAAAERILGGGRTYAIVERTPHVDGTETPLRVANY